MWGLNFGAVLTAPTCVSSDSPCPAPCPAPTTGPGRQIGSSCPPLLVSSGIYERIRVVAGWGAGEGTGVCEGSDSICFVLGSKQRGYCLLIDCF